ncbi:pre-peptidase C-terminal domain-containing protein [Aliikangiella coralliicola]|uniref:pre-peptidase C-terminal domain-containing protein n=1 Tax=Aliikangiella coralliicola TaxID=2592383 RepID=UPI00143DD5AF|nr:pre-peptidase C-terminal domain-containing protein [Aliikangiella coralliicola]
MKKLSLLAIAIVSGQSLATEQSSIADFMNRFHEDPATAMKILPEHDNPNVIFNEKEISSRDYVSIKAAERNGVISNQVTARSAIVTSSDNPARLVDSGNNVITNLFEITENIPSKYHLDTQPWSDTYWPLYSGALAYRYGDQDLHRSNPRTWKDYSNFSHITKPVTSYELHERYRLSPAEKYDLLVGDADFTFSKKNWQQGERYYNNSGHVERWMGLCHGWAPAAYMLDRPTKTLTLKDPDNQDIVFYPSDIKALGTSLWAETRFNTKFIGGRCNIKNPEENENGRILDQNCFDNNPGSWHISVLNQLGKNHRSLIMDATYDYQVWNQPILSYKITYFNPETNQIISDPKNQLLPISDYQKDKFSEFRSHEATHIIGVKMDVQYMVETSPTHRTSDTANYDGISRVSYHYDLELNENGKIIGGEWYNQAHPDFLWTPAKNAVAQSYYDVNDSKWDVTQPIPVEWRSQAKRASYYSQPMTTLVNQLFAHSSAGTLGGSLEKSNLSGEKGEWRYYSVDIPAGTANLTVKINGGSGDADLYVRKNQQPTEGSYDCRPWINGNVESCEFNQPETTTWHIGVKAYSDYESVKLRATWQ